MKIYPNDLCPCGSGKKYKKCCLLKDKMSNHNQAGMLGALPIDIVDNEADFIINRQGAVVFKDESKQPILELSEGKTTKRVLSLGYTKQMCPVATIQEQDGPICYKLPDQYIEWCITCVGLASTGNKLFPADVIFTKRDNNYFADIL